MLYSPARSTGFQQLRTLSATSYGFIGRQSSKLRGWYR
ncbi:hypothetical protein LEP1GSC188_3449 [Leptospira weilii serovar Topaz str. LT2116]|uniref:Uncharacterized protein n=1 Tax=Leptospira weilii serovar Topaz str. LT2116 TaxID=1088540 RepID=M3FL80_9LEPT|nr:hypothetical protein LEP1GSC188_3449 [Leptospira weilii serovar Topaz str. LT2116]